MGCASSQPSESASTSVAQSQPSDARPAAPLLPAAAAPGADPAAPAPQLAPQPAAAAALPPQDSEPAAAPPSAAAEAVAAGAALLPAADLQPIAAGEAAAAGASLPAAFFQPSAAAEAAAEGASLPAADLQPSAAGEAAAAGAAPLPAADCQPQLPALAPGAAPPAPPAPAPPSLPSIDASAFYREYKGHLVPHLAAVHAGLLAQSREAFVFLCGDSSLDNKHWFFGACPQPFVAAANGMERLLEPPHSIPDVAHCLNALLAASAAPLRLACINGAVEESALHERSRGVLLKQDAWVAATAGPRDAIVVCCGGNDVVLKPLPDTVQALLALLTRSTPASLADGSAPGLDHFVRLFRDQLGDFVRRLCANRPRLCIVCMVYYPQLSSLGAASWASHSLGQMGYTQRPELLQSIIRAVYQHGVRALAAPEGTRVVPLPLFEVLDPASGADYLQRVEPSRQGGEKMAAAILRVVQQEFGGASV